MSIATQVWNGAIRFQAFSQRSFQKKYSIIVVSYVTFGKSLRTIILEATVRKSFTAQLFRQASQVLSVTPATEFYF